MQAEEWQDPASRQLLCLLGEPVLFAFKKEYKPLIVSGRKTQTVRIWKKCTLREGGVVNSPGLGRLRINEIARVKLKDLTEEDARLDGFDSRAEMLAALRKIYKLKQEDGANCYRIRFKYLGKDGAEGTTRSADAARSKKPESLKTAKRSSGPKKPSKPGAPRKSTGSKKRKPAGTKSRGRQETLFPPF